MENKREFLKPTRGRVRRVNGDRSPHGGVLRENNSSTLSNTVLLKKPRLSENLAFNRSNPLSSNYRRSLMTVNVSTAPPTPQPTVDKCYPSSLTPNISTSSLPSPIINKRRLSSISSNIPTAPTPKPIVKKSRPSLLNPIISPSSLPSPKVTQCLRSSITPNNTTPSILPPIINKCRRSLIPNVSTTINSLSDNFLDEKRPLLVKPPFLYRNHIGYKMLSNDRTLDDVKDVVSLEFQRANAQTRKMLREHARKEISTRLEDSVVRIKKDILAQNLYDGKFANDIFVFEFFKVNSGIIVFNKAYCDIYYCVVRNGVTKLKERVLSYCFINGEKRERNLVVEIVPPKPSSDSDELYLYVEAKLYENTSMKSKGRRSRSIAVNSNTDSLSVTQLYGAVCISKKAKKRADDESPWSKNCREGGIDLIAPEQGKVDSDNLVKLVKKCAANGRLGSNASLSYELSDENGYGQTEIKPVKKGSELLKKRRLDAKTTKDKDIIYDVSQLIKQRITLAETSFVAPLSILKKRGRKEFQSTKAVVKKPHAYAKDIAHQKGTRTFKCIFCSKTFPSYDLLKFHFVHSYPSFTFEFSSSNIKVSFDKSIFENLEKLKNGSGTDTEQLYKIKLTSSETNDVQDVTPSSAPVIHKRLIGFPYNVNSWYSTAFLSNGMTANGPQKGFVYGLYGHECPLAFARQAVKSAVNDLWDFDPHERAFYYLWNTFNFQRANRRLGMTSMYEKLNNFIRQHFDDIEKFHLKSVWNTFLLYFSNLRIINERQFFTLSFYGSKFENNWFGCNAPLTKDSEFSITK